jgi:hypothetical protein
LRIIIHYSRGKAVVPVTSSDGGMGALLYGILLKNSQCSLSDTSTG